MTYILITDDNFRDFIGDGERIEWGGEVRVLNAKPRMRPPGAPGAPAVISVDQLIPRDQWPDIIAKKDEEKSWLEDLLRAAEIPYHDQGSLGYCHAYAMVHAMEAQRLCQGHPYVALSAESIGGVVTNWRNEGAMPDDDMDVAVKFGACPASMMDRPWSLSPKRWNPQWMTERANYRVKEWIDLDLGGKKTFDACVTAAIKGIPYNAGYAWQSHATMGGMRVINLGRGKYAMRCRNSWKAFGDDGFYDLAEGKGTPDLDCCAPVSMEAFDK